jgi:hypothetical protein
MLGAVKDEGGEGQVPLFRLLARRWKSLAPVKRERTGYLATRHDKPKQTRKWISKARPAAHAPQQVKPATAKRAWTPWLWVK